MSKKDKSIKQIREEVRLETKKVYEDKINSLENKCKDYDSLVKELNSEKEKVLKLEEELRQCKDWVNRMLEYCNMDEKDLLAEKVKMEVDAEYAKTMKTALCIFGLFNR